MNHHAFTPAEVISRACDIFCKLYDMPVGDRMFDLGQIHGLGYSLSINAEWQTIKMLSEYLTHNISMEG